MTIGTFEIFEFKNNDSYENGTSEFSVTVRIFKTWGIKNYDSYENGASKAKARAVTRIASLTPTGPVIVGIFFIFHINNDDSYKDRKLDTYHPCDYSHF